VDSFLWYSYSIGKIGIRSCNPAQRDNYPASTRGIVVKDKKIKGKSMYEAHIQKVKSQISKVKSLLSRLFGTKKDLRGINSVSRVLVTKK